MKDDLVFRLTREQEAHLSPLTITIQLDDKNGSTVKIMDGTDVCDEFPISETKKHLDAFINPDKCGVCGSPGSLGDRGCCVNCWDEVCGVVLSINEIQDEMGEYLDTLSGFAKSGVRIPSKKELIYGD